MKDMMKTSRHLGLVPGGTQRLTDGLRDAPMWFEESEASPWGY